MQRRSRAETSGNDGEPIAGRSGNLAGQAEQQNSQQGMIRRCLKLLRALKQKERGQLTEQSTAFNQISNNGQETQFGGRRAFANSNPDFV